MTQSTTPSTVALSPTHGSHSRAVFTTTLLALLGAVLPLLTLTGCGQEDGHSRAPDRQVMALGREVYNRQNSCVLCHQDNGIGKYKQFPPLSRNSNVNAQDPERLIKAISHGMIGELKVDGRTFNGAMSAWESLLTDEEIAAVLTYVRNSWGNQAPSVTTEQVAKVHSAYAGRKTPWTVTELVTGKPAGPVEIAFDENEDPFELGLKVYNTEGMCVSCHQNSGEGTPGSYPPLAGSEWVTSDPDRLIKIALHGLSGPLERHGVAYSNEMPAQGALLDDRLMAATLTYVRAAWGNEAGPIYADQVSKVRKRFDGKEHTWSTEELAAVDKQSPLTDLTYTIVEHDESWQQLPPLSEQKVLSTGKIDDGYITTELPGVSKDRQQRRIAAIFEGDLNVPADGEYTLSMEIHNMGVLWIDGEVVIDRKAFSRWPKRDRKILTLTRGKHALRLECAKLAQPGGVRLSWANPDLDRNLIKITSAPTNDVILSDPTMVIGPSKTRPIVHRGRFDRQSPQGVGVGYPQRINLSFDAMRMQWNQIWRGDFVNAGGHWSGRNEKYLPPAGSDEQYLTLQPPFTHLQSPDATWPKDAGLRNSPEGYRFRGYRLNPEGEPAFFYTFNDFLIEDRPEPITTATGSHIARHLSVASPKAAEGMYYLAAAGDRIIDAGEGVYHVDGNIAISFPGWQGETPVIRQEGDQQQLLLKLHFAAGGSTKTNWTTDDTRDLQQQAAWTQLYQWLQ